MRLLCEQRIDERLESRKDIAYEADSESQTLSADHLQSLRLGTLAERFILLRSQRVTSKSPMEGSWRVPLTERTREPPQKEKSSCPHTPHIGFGAAFIAAIPIVVPQTRLGSLVPHIQRFVNPKGELPPSGCFNTPPTRRCLLTYRVRG